mmetsp:Transcript_14144/g.43876  ORF Transcript_14144/g.43876 Transcript_14144/m.43876 type:complete len:282 (+) Transcript_14144:461-1306(+)
MSEKESTTTSAPFTSQMKHAGVRSSRTAANLHDEAPATSSSALSANLAWLWRSEYVSPSRTSSSRAACIFSIMRFRPFTSDRVRKNVTWLPPPASHGPPLPSSVRSARPTAARKRCVTSACCSLQTPRIHAACRRQKRRRSCGRPCCNLSEGRNGPAIPPSAMSTRSLARSTQPLRLSSSKSPWPKDCSKTHSGLSSTLPVSPPALSRSAWAARGVSMRNRAVAPRAAAAAVSTPRSSSRGSRRMSSAASGLVSMAAFRASASRVAVQLWSSRMQPVNASL